MAEPTTTIVPFSNTAILPSCAAGCGALYDANGACVPPAVPTDAATTAYTSCFCLDTRVIALSTATTGVCDDVCQGAELNSVATWFRNMCNVDDAAKNTDTTTATATDSASETGSHRKNTGGGGDWLSNHWKWVIMLVVLVVAIVGIWVGACIFRRRYLKKKEQQKFTLKNPGGVSPEGVVGAAGASGTSGAAGPDAAARQSTPAQSGVSSSPSEKIRRWTGRS